MRRSAKQRRDLILERLADERRVEAAELASTLEVAVETVRRDLRLLEDRGALVRAHGGAVPLDTLVGPVRRVADAMSACLGAAAAQFFPATGSVLVGGGPHCHALAERVVEHPEPWNGLQVATTSVDVAVVMSRRDDLVVHNLGGSLAPDLCQHGPWALDELAELRVDVAFLAPDGIDVDAGLTMDDARSSTVASAAVAAADRLVVLADAGAVGRAGFRRFARPEDVHVLVVDAAAREVELGAIADLGVKLERVEVT